MQVYCALPGVYGVHLHAFICRISRLLVYVQRLLVACLRLWTELDRCKHGNVYYDIAYVSAMFLLPCFGKYVVIDCICMCSENVKNCEVALFGIWLKRYVAVVGSAQRQELQQQEYQETQAEANAAHTAGFCNARDRAQIHVKHRETVKLINIA